MMDKQETKDVINDSVLIGFIQIIRYNLLDFSEWMNRLGKTIKSPTHFCYSPLLNMILI